MWQWFVDCAKNQREDENIVGHVPRSSGLLRLEASWARVSEYFCLIFHLRV
jgi:hypothetical protein